MESFEDIQQQEEAHLLGEIGALGAALGRVGLEPRPGPRLRDTIA